jgi:hypothetical protein
MVRRDPQAPSDSTYHRRFGSFSAAVEAAGFDPYTPGGFQSRALIVTGTSNGSQSRYHRVGDDGTPQCRIGTLREPGECRVVTRQSAARHRDACQNPGCYGVAAAEQSPTTPAEIAEAAAETTVPVLNADDGITPSTEADHDYEGPSPRLYPRCGLRPAVREVDG